ncbi:hypothetical protein ACWGI0_06060 [Streptomyces sp. NPDC054802]
MTHWKDDRIGSAERGENPTVLARMSTGWAVIGDIQHLPGYCLLLYAGKANHLTDLPRDERARSCSTSHCSGRRSNKRASNMTRDTDA